MQVKRRSFRRPAAALTIAFAIATASAARPLQPAGQLLAKGLAGPMKGAEQIVFAVRGVGGDPHWYANFGHWSSDPNKKLYSTAGGRLCRLDLRTMEVTVLLSDPAGGVRDPHVGYDGRTVLFSYRPGGEEHYNLYEIDAIKGGRARRITDAPYDDIEPAYLPGGDIVFCSSRCRRWVQCWHTEVAVLHRCGRDGKNIRAISSNVEHDNTPAVLPDGRLLYTRWEYVDRSQVDFHHLWTINPDGTGQMTYFGNMHPHTVMIDAKPIPHSPRVAAIFSPGHGANEHRGRLYVVDPAAGPDSQGSAAPVKACPPWVRDPYPFSEECFLVARRHELLLVDAAAGKAEVVHRLSEADRKGGLELHEPQPLRPRPTERLIPDRTDLSEPTGRLILADVAHGRRMDGVKRGEVKKLLVLESLPKPVNFSGGMEPLTWLGSFTLERVLGTVPVEPDGSAYFELPAHRPVFFVALDEDDLSVKRMQSFVSVMPGETTSCAGCHEHRNQTAREQRSLLATRRPPSRIKPFEGQPDVLDFPRDIQPILDRHCVKCHNFEKRAGKVVLCGDRGPKYSHSYWTLMAMGQVADGRNAWSNNAPRTIGSSASPLLKKLSGGHNKVKVSEAEWRTVWLWIEASAPYPGTYAALGSGMAYGNAWGAAGEVLRRRCYSCHYLPRKGGKPVPGKIALPARGHPYRGGARHQRFEGKYLPSARRSLEIVLNLTRPAKSPLVLAPLARAAGGWGVCGDPRVKEKNAKPHADSPEARARGVFRSTKEADYRRLVAAIAGAKAELDRIKRFDMPGFRPNVHYVREMKRYGILPKHLKATDPIDVYRTDQAYWRSFWVADNSR